jgi:hypothetical protein
MSEVLEHDIWKRVAASWPEFCARFVGLDPDKVETAWFKSG